MPDQLFVGTSGFSYKEWKGSFYPKDLAARKFLGFYSRELSTTEINNTFYRMPSKKATSSWAEQVPEGFLFSVKMNRRVTHKKRLKDVKEEMGWFGEGVAPIREKLGCLLVQLPPWFKIDLDALASFLEEHLKGYRMAFEFRHSSWFCQETYDLLASRGAALCVAES
jgi:uncharacterized protein YecE (DUF72 family)